MPACFPVNPQQGRKPQKGSKMPMSGRRQSVRLGLAAPLYQISRKVVALLDGLQERGQLVFRHLVARASTPPGEGQGPPALACCSERSIPHQGHSAAAPACASETGAICASLPAGQTPLSEGSSAAIPWHRWQRCGPHRQIAVSSSSSGQLHSYASLQLKWLASIRSPRVWRNRLCKALARERAVHRPRGPVGPGAC